MKIDTRARTFIALLLLFLMVESFVFPTIAFADTLNTGQISNAAEEVATSGEGAGAPSVRVIAPPPLNITDRYLTLSAEVTDDGDGDSPLSVKVYYRADPMLPWEEDIMTPTGEGDVYAVTLDTYVYFGTAKENKKFFTDKVYYYIVAKDADGNETSTQENIVECQQYYGDVTDYSKLPYLLITELVVATTAKSPEGNGDKFEFLEIYNNSDSPIDFSGYELHYMTSPSVRPTEYTAHWPDNRNLIIQPRSTVVIWINTNDWANKGNFPAQDMQEYYYGTADNPKDNWNLDTGATLTSEGEDANLSWVHFAGQPNSGQHRGWGIYTNTGELVVEAYYNKNNDTANNTDVTADMSIQFRYPTDGGKRMQKISANTTYGNPGEVLDYQVPAVCVDMPEDTENPVINYSHKDVDIQATEANGIDHEIWVSVTDDTIVNTIYLEFKLFNDESDKPQYSTLQSFIRDGETSFYCAYLDFGNFIRQSKMEFRIRAQDIVGHTTYTDWYTLNILPYEDPLEDNSLSLSLQDGQYVGGDIKLSATTNTDQLISMWLDGVATRTQEDSQRYALFVYEVYETDFNFRNGVTIKNPDFGTSTDEYRTLFNFDISGAWTTYTVQIPLDLLLPSDTNPDGGMIGLHAGNRYTAVYDRSVFDAAIEKYLQAKSNNDAAGMAEAKQDFIYGDQPAMKEYQKEMDEVGLNLNRDDYSFRDARLVLADGTVLYDTNPANNGKYDETKRDNIYKLGDGSDSAIRQVFFKFDIPEGQVDTVSYRVDTTTLQDGAHAFKAQCGDEVKEIEFYVDNTAPEFEFGFEDGAVLKGMLSFTPDITENGSGVAKSYGYLDGNRIGIPYYTTSGNLDAGEHLLEVTVTDNVGNSTTKSITFRTEQEQPFRPADPENNGAVLDGTDAELSIGVSDPSGDALTVEFFNGSKFVADAGTGFTAYHNNVDIEPPPYVVYPGETEFTEEEYALVSTVDGKYMDSQSYQLPYQRFAVKIDPSLPRNGVVNVRWYGKSFEGRKVTLYAWNIIEEDWEAMDYVIAGSEDFTLEAELTIEFFANVKTNEVNVLIQDEVEEPSKEKFTFAWVTDQQYYTQRNAYDDEDHIIMELQHKWIIEHKDEYNIKYMFSTGDLVNRQYEPYQWDVVSESYALLENSRIPYGVLAGNHDVNFSQDDYSVYGEYFGEDRYKDKSWYGESYQNNRGHYDLVSVNGIEFMMVYMGWGIYEPEIEWMNQVISANPDKIVILNFHEYLGTTGVVTEIGQEIYDKVVVPNPNVRMVLCGHLHGSASRVDEIDDDGDGVPDRKVWQLLADYQGSMNTSSNYEGGDGFIRLFEFDVEKGEVNVITVSPWLEYLNELRGLEQGDEGAYNIYRALGHMNYEGLRGDGLAINGNGTGSAYKSLDVGNNSFVYEWDITPQIKRVATDAIVVDYRSDESLGKVDVSSGEVASIDWKNLTEGTEYGWYAVITDANGGKYVTDVYTFVTAGTPPTEGTGNGLTGWQIALISVAAVVVAAAAAAGIAVAVVKRRKRAKDGEEKL